MESWIFVLLTRLIFIERSIVRVYPPLSMASGCMPFHGWAVFPHLCVVGPHYLYILSLWICLLVVTSGFNLTTNGHSNLAITCRMQNQCHNWVHIAAGNQEGRCSASVRLYTSLLCELSSLLHCLHFYAFLGNIPVQNGQTQRWWAAWCHWTQQGWNGAMLGGKASSHSHELACCGVSSVLIQQCVLNNASDQKYMPNKITCRTAKKQCPEAQWVLTFSFPLGK